MKPTASTKRWKSPAAVIPCVLLVMSCAGGLSSIPDNADALMAKADQKFSEGDYYQSKELYKAFLSRFPGHQKSDAAQFYLAESYFNEEEYALATVEYRVLVSNYGYSDFVDDAFFKMAVSAYEEAPRPDLDQTKSFEALSLFQQFLQTFPSSSLVDEAHQYINRIYEKLAEKDFKNAMFYYRWKRYTPASIYFKKVIDNYPSGEYWIKSLYYQGRILLARGDREGAREHFERVIAYPKSIEIKGEAEKALEELKGN